MKVSASLSLTAGVSRELRRLDSEGVLEPLDSEFSPGILRGVNGNKNVGLLNAGLNRARIVPIFASQILVRTLIEFDEKAAEILGTQRYLIKGYAGKTTETGALAYLHAHDNMRSIVNAVVAGQDNPDVTTMFYGGSEPAEPYRDRSMADAINGLGVRNFTQVEPGQITQFGPTDFHGEPPLPVGTPRLLLVAYSYE